MNRLFIVNFCSKCSIYRSLFHLNRSFATVIVKPVQSVEDAWKNSSTIRALNLRINDLGRCGKIAEARKLFDGMVKKDIYSYAQMINIYIKNGDLFKAEKIYLDLPEVNIFIESAMIHGYAKAGLIDEARKVFDGMPYKNVYSWTSLISGYLQLGDVDEARRLFDLMDGKNNFTWTTMIIGYARQGLVKDAKQLFEKMPQKDVVACTVMIKCFVENDMIVEARQLFDKMSRRNLYSWNLMLSAYLNARQVNKATQLFDSMPSKNVVTWTTMFTGLARNGYKDIARTLFDRMPKKDIAAWNSMITVYAFEGSMQEADFLFNKMPKRNTVTWNAIIDGYAKNGLGHEALKHLILMLRDGFRLNETTMTSVLSVCESEIEVCQIHCLLIHFGFDQENPLVNSLIYMYSRFGDLIASRLAFEALMDRDVVSWTSMILAYSNHGFGDQALQVFSRMVKSGTNPDDITFVGVLSACSRSGLVGKGLKVFASMSHAYGLKPRAAHYSCLVDILGRAGYIEQAWMVIQQMPACEKDAAVLGALLGACILHGNVVIATQIGEELLEMEKECSGSYVLLANAYAARGNWKEVAGVRKKMKERMVKKEPGFSEIEVKKKRNVFVSGDRSHPQVEEIYAILEDCVLPQMINEGYMKTI